MRGVSRATRTKVAASRLDRHRGGGRPPTPATPPCIRVRTRRFKKVALAVLEQRRKVERSKVCLGKPYVESLGERQIPGSAAAAGHIGRQLGTHPSSSNAARRRRTVFHCRHKAHRNRRRTQPVKEISTPGVWQNPK